MAIEKINNLILNKYKYSHFYFFIFQCFIFLTFFHNSYNSLFTYPKALTLTNGNIFIIHQLGIDVYDSTLKNLIISVKNFTTSEQIADQNVFSKVTIKRFNHGEDENNLIFGILINKIYIFKENGEILYDEKDTSIISQLVGEYYDLTLIEKNGQVYSYVIAFVNSNNAGCLFFFEFNYGTTQNTLIEAMDPFKVQKSTSIYGIMNKGISCEIMSHSVKGNILVCFFNVADVREFITKYINLETYESVDLAEQSIELFDVKGIKSITTSDKKKCLICMNFSDKDTLCVNYTIEDNSFSGTKDLGVYCRDGHFSNNLEYFSQKNQFLFYGTDNAGEITAQILDENLCPINGSFRIVQGFNVYGASIIYSSSYDDFFVLSDINCENPDNFFISINGELPPTETPTTITTIPTTILTTIPTTILTTIPTTILTTIPTTILTTIPTTIPTNNIDNNTNININSNSNNDTRNNPL